MNSVFVLLAILTGLAFSSLSFSIDRTQQTITYTCGDDESYQKLYNQDEARHARGFPIAYHFTALPGGVDCPLPNQRGGFLLSKFVENTFLWTVVAGAVMVAGQSRKVRHE